MKTTPLHSPDRSQLRRGSFLIAFGQRLALPLFFLGAALLVQPCAATPFQWEYTGSLNSARSSHTATLLSDGRVLAAGGSNDGPALASAELYDLATGTWTFTGSLNNGRADHTATLLSDGRILVAGGDVDIYGNTLASAELYDLATGTWTVTGSLNNARARHTATLLSDGRVLVVGGACCVFPWHFLASAELYDPATGSWTVTGSLNTARAYHTATLLPNGEVLVAGGSNGSDLASAELYDPASGTWTATGSLNTARWFHTATLLSDGKVLVAGGQFLKNGHFVPTPSAELYDPATGSWTLTGRLYPARDLHTATLLSDGRVLAAGGSGGGASAKLYNSASGTWTATGSLNTGRSSHTATLLSDGRVLAAGGSNNGVFAIASAELYDPGIVAATQVDGLGAFDNQGNEVTFKFRASQPDDSSNVGRFSFCDPAAGVCITNAGIHSLSITGNSAALSGRAQLDDGTRVTFNVSVTDNGWPGTLDTISISLSDGYSVSRTLTSGNIRIY